MCRYALPGLDVFEAWAWALQNRNRVSQQQWSLPSETPLDTRTGIVIWVTAWCSPP